MLLKDIWIYRPIDIWIYAHLPNISKSVHGVSTKMKKIRLHGDQDINLKRKYFHGLNVFVSFLSRVYCW